MRPVLALDLATRTGWTYRPPNGLVRSGFVQLPSDMVGRLQVAEEWLAERLAPLAFSKGDLVYEGGVSRFHQPFRIACHIEAVLLMTAATWGIPPERIHEVAPKTVKKHATGKGNATKAEVLAAVNERHGLQLTDDNVADSRALLDYWLDREAG